LATVSERAEGVAKRGASMDSRSSREASRAFVAFLWFAGSVCDSGSCTWVIFGGIVVSECDERVREKEKEKEKEQEKEREREREIE
jgi:hypothetical protein